MFISPVMPQYPMVIEWLTESGDVVYHIRRDSNVSSFATTVPADALQPFTDYRLRLQGQRGQLDHWRSIRNKIETYTGWLRWWPELCILFLGTLGALVHMEACRGPGFAPAGPRVTARRYRCDKEPSESVNMRICMTPLFLVACFSCVAGKDQAMVAVTRQPQQSCIEPYGRLKLASYGRLSVKCSWMASGATTRNDVAGLVVNFAGSDTGADVLCLLDLRNIGNINEPRKFGSDDLKALAWRGSAPFKLYFTAGAWEKYENSAFLRAVLKRLFSTELLQRAIVPSANSAIEQHVEHEELLQLLPDKPVGAYRFIAPAVVPRE